MNPLLSHLQPYPFERLRQLFTNITPNPSLRPISLGMGEPKHPTPAFIQQAMIDAIVSTPSGLASYPVTTGEPKLREAFARWLKKRYDLNVNPLALKLALTSYLIASGGVPQSVLPNIRGCGLAGRCPALLCAK